MSWKTIRIERLLDGETKLAMIRSASLFLALWGFTTLIALGQTKVAARVDASHPGASIPRSFMGLSREWRPFVAPDEGPSSAVHPTFLRLLSHLCAFNEQPLCIRVGGNSADGVRESPSAERWQQIAEVFKTTRTPFIINLNLQRENLELDQAMVRDAQKYLPKDAILTFELGNEPDGWAGRYRPADYAFEQYLPVFNRIGHALVPSLTPGLAGPAYAHAAPPQVLKDFLAAQPGLINLLTVHSYRFDPKSKPKVERLLHEGDSSGYAAKFVDGIKVAHDAGLKLRMTESGSAWGGGVEGFSDAFAASLWTLDVFFEFAKVGLDGIHPHGGGMGHYSPIKEGSDPKTKKAFFIASAPYYGMLVFAEATAHNARFLPIEGDAGKVKLWATLDDQGITRIVAINKDTQAACDLSITVDGSEATVKRLEAPSLSSTSGICFGGQTFDQSKDGDPIGTLHAARLPIREQVLQLSVAPVSAALITIRR